MERVMWLVLGAVTLVAALRAGSSPRAMYVARLALVLLMVVFGAAVNAAYLLSGSDYYETFADPSPFAFVQDTWASFVVPNQGVFISLLIAAEVTVGLLVAAGGAWMQSGLIALIAFHIGQLPFGWYMWAWAPPMLLAFVLLLHAQRRTPTPPLTLHRSPGRPGPSTGRARAGEDVNARSTGRHERSHEGPQPDRSWP